MSKQAINLILAGSNYSFTIESEAEEVYRLAEREINNYISEFQKHNIKEFSTKDYLAMTALKLAILNINNKREANLDQDDVESLHQIKSQIEDYLNSLESEQTK